MTGDRPELSVVIPTWNGLDLVRKCLDSLAGQGYVEFETIVSDDGSTDGTAAAIHDTYPNVTVVVSEENRGFVSAANRGIEASRGQWVFLLNNDVTLAPDCLERLMHAARTGAAGMFAPLVLWTEDDRLIYSAGDGVDRNGRPFSQGYKLPREQFHPPMEPFGVSGGYGLFRRDLLDDVGLFDPAFGAYFEDSDLCFRARWAGYRAAVVLDAVAWHEGSATIRDRLWWRTRQCYQNHVLLVIKNFSFSMLCWNAGSIARERLHQCARLFTVARSEWGARRALAYTVAAWFGLAARIPGALARRRGIMSRRRCSSVEMQRWLQTGSPDA